MINLIKLLDDMECPDYALDKILNWAHESFLNGFEFNPTIKTRKGTLKWMKKMVVHNDAFYPNPVSVNLNNETKIDVICYDFALQLLSILQNKKLMKQENLLLDMNDPTKMYQAPNNILGESLSGSRYRDIYQKEHANNIGNLPLLVVPLCLWGDATHNDTAGRFKLEPWTFSPLIFTEKARRNKDFWGMLGYVKFLKESTAQKQTYQKGDTTRMYHKQLSAILGSLQSCDEKLKNVAIPFDNNEVQYFDITCPVMFVMSDTEGADRICGRYESYRLKIKCHCRMCNVNSDKLDHENVNSIIYHLIGCIILQSIEQKNKE